MNYDINEKLRELKNEELIWIIYIGIIIFSFYSNSLERKYFIYSDLACKKKYQQTLIIIFSILIVVYLYFLKDSYDSLKKIRPYDSLKKKKLVYLSFIGSFLIAISGFIFLYIAINDKSIDVEIAFNWKMCWMHIYFLKTNNLLVK